jgi:hypothetical protein
VAENVEFVIRTYNDNPRRVFDKATNVADNGRVCLPFISRSSTPNLTRIERVLREARTSIRKMAAEQINISESVPQTRLDVKDVFVCPPLRPGRLRAVPVVSGESARDREIALEVLLRESNNLIIVGARESGKSSLAHYMAVLCAEGVCDRPRVPVVIDFRQLKRNIYGIKRATASYLGEAARGVNVDTALREGDFIFLLDNFTIQSATEGAESKRLFEGQSSCRWVCFTDAIPRPIDRDQEHEFLSGFREIVIEQLPRKSIRELSRRWCDQIGTDSDQIFTTVMNQLQRDSLPRTGYIVTLLLWAVYQERRFERINEAVLLTNMIDYLLGKADFQQALRREFDPTSKEITLQCLAQFLRGCGGVTSVNEVTKFLIAFFQQKGLTYGAADILNKLIECGILYRSEDDISFKYRCFEEYFLACLFRDDPEERDKALEGYKFIEYARELDLLSGLRRRNSDIMTVVGKVVAEQAPDEITRQRLDRFDAIAQAESKVGLSRRKLNDIKKKKITREQIDNLADATDRRLAKKGQENRSISAASNNTNGDSKLPCTSSTKQMPAGMFLEALDLYGRILRNSEFSDATEKEAGARLYLHNCVKLFLILCEVIDEVLEDAIDNGKEPKIDVTPDDMVAIRYLIYKAVFLGVQKKVLDELGTEKMFSIYETILK